jgi:hypothetical protein
LPPAILNLAIQAEMARMLPDLMGPARASRFLA